MFAQVADNHCCQNYAIRFINRKINQAEINRRLENEVNILIDKSIDDINIKYNIFNYEKYIKNKYIYKIIDFDRSILYNDIYVKQYDDDFLNKKKYNYNNTLFKNIF